MTSQTEQQIEPVPQVPGLPVLGNVREVHAGTAIEDLMGLVREHGPIFELRFPGSSQIIVTGEALVEELCDESRFRKLVSPELGFLRLIAGDGLFTAETAQPNWRKAHNILIPAFGMRSIQGYIPQMTDLAGQLVDKWGRLNPDDEIDVPAEMTRLTFDTIGLCGFDYRFNSFYRGDQPHPFIAAMVRTLTVALARLTRLPGQDRLMLREQRQLRQDVDLMNSLVDSLIAERRADAGSTAPNDLLQAMLTGVDRDTGEGLDDVNIRYQIITFLIAGHETTSGLLSFAIYFLLKHPDALARAREEVDQVLGGPGGPPPTPAEIGRLRWIGQILNEALRLWPPAAAFTLTPLEGSTVIGGRYRIEEGTQLTVFAPMLHRDPAVWGDDAEDFDPEHFSPEATKDHPPNAFKPFGNGVRECIGRGFALQEARLVLAMILQRFELIDSGNYEFKLKETLTIKPDGLRIAVRPRTDRAAVAVAEQPAAGDADGQAQAEEEAPEQTGAGTPLLVLFGSNLGNAEGLAREIDDDATRRGFETTLAPLDEYVDRLPSEGAVVIVTASYNGKPPDNAARFCGWLSNGLAADALAGVRYAVFGCGDSNWASTFQAIPTLVDEQLAARGATRIAQRGAGDAADDFDGQFRSWYAPLWTELADALGLEKPTDVASDKPRLEVEVVEDSSRTPLLSSLGAKPLAVLVNREALGSPPDGNGASDGRSTRHVELTLPDDMPFQAGDHLAILPHNADALVHRALARFGLDEGTVVRIRARDSVRNVFPRDRPIAAGELLAGYVELQEPATRAQLAALARYAGDEDQRQRLQELAGDGDDSVERYRAEILNRRASLLDVLDELDSCAPPLDVFLSLVSTLRPRFYSISSSPLVDPRRCSVTVGVLDAPARSGRGTYRGVCSGYLASQPPGAVLHGFVRKPSMPFCPPDDPALPMIMVGPGTGVAPFRGFLQDRAALAEKGTEVGPALLFFGCRDPRRDYLYEDELKGFAERGVVEVISAFSRVNGQPKTYVQQRIGERADDVWALLERGALVYVCGDAGRVAPAVRAAFAGVYRDKTGASEDDAEAWLTGLVDEDRYLEDIWAAS